MTFGVEIEQWGYLTAEQRGGIGKHGVEPLPEKRRFGELEREICGCLGRR